MRSEFEMQINKSHQDIVLKRHMQEAADRRKLQAADASSGPVGQSMLDILVERMRSIGNSKRMTDAHAN